MIAYASRWWYALVSASPRPEAGEIVNVALVIGDDGTTRMVYVPGLPRLSCLASSSDVDIYQAVLRSLETRIASGEEISTLQKTLGPHLLVSEPRRLIKEPTEALVRALTHDLLLTHSEQALPMPLREPRARDIQQLDRVLRRVIPGFGVYLERAVTPDKLYPEAAKQIFRTQVPTLERAIRSPHRDLLIGSVVVDVQHSIERIRSKSAKVSQALWQYQRAKEGIRDLAGKEVRTLGIVLNGAAVPELQEVRAFVRHLWQADADEVLEIHAVSDATKLQQQVSWLVEDATS